MAVGSTRMDFAADPDQRRQFGCHIARAVHHHDRRTGTAVRQRQIADIIAAQALHRFRDNGKPGISGDQPDGSLQFAHFDDFGGAQAQIMDRPQHLIGIARPSRSGIDDQRFVQQLRQVQRATFFCTGCQR